MTMKKETQQIKDAVQEAKEFAESQNIDFTNTTEELIEHALFAYREQIKNNVALTDVGNCSSCGKPHWLRDEDAGTEREIKRLCVNCA